MLQFLQMALGLGAKLGPYQILGRQMMSVNISNSPEFTASVPQKLFDGPFVWERVGNYDITPDGQRFVMIFNDSPEGATEVVRVITNLGSMLAGQNYDKQ